MGLFAEWIGVITFQEDEALSELSWWLTGLVFLLVIGLFYGLLTWLLSALEEVPRAWRVGLLGGLLAVPFHWLPIWLLAGTLGGLLGGLLGGTLGGLFIRLLPGLNSFVKHFILRCLLSWQGNLPWNLVPFLDEAAERLLLRKASRSYIFVHRLLLEYFVSLGEPVSTISISKSSKP
jgi:hypothetical protein